MKEKIETELKFSVKNPMRLFKELSKVIKKPPKVFYVLDEIYGAGGGYKEEKIRKRTVFHSGKTKIIYEKTKWLGGKIKKVKEKKINGFAKQLKLENSYEKIRFFYKVRDYDICIDFYPIGVFLEIEGDTTRIKEIARKLGFSLEDNIKENIDFYYRKKYGDKNDHWRFGNF